MTSVISTNPHTPLISALTTFYTLLTDLCYVSPSDLVLPSITTRRHPPNTINRAAALRHGFSNAAVDLAYQIPYITSDSYEFDGSTVCLCYIIPPGKEIVPTHGIVPDDGIEEDEVGEEPWDFARDPTYQERNDIFTGHNALMLTRGLLYGKELVYDLDKRTITAWNHIDTPEPWTNVPAYEMTSWENPLYQWIYSFLTLSFLPFNESLLFPLPPVEERGYNGVNPTERDLISWERAMNVRVKEREFEDVYVSCGWNGDAANKLGSDMTNNGQSSSRVWERLEEARKEVVKHFRGDEFEKMSKEWKENVYDKIPFNYA
ncbi:hypothetical protein B7463_g3025, partial [Scytalidium lignicola]